MEIIDNLFNGKTVSEAIAGTPTQLTQLESDLENLQSKLIAATTRLADVDEDKWTLVAGETFRVGDVVEKELSRFDQKKLRAAAFNAYYCNPHARGIINSLVQLTVGTGATLVIDPNADESVRDNLQREWDEFTDRVKWQRKQIEIVRRYFRDGEVFLRFREDGRKLIFTFLEPDWIESVNDNITHGIETESDDVSKVKSYRMIPPSREVEEIIPPEEIIHLKNNVDENEKRGRSELEVSIKDLTELQTFRDYRIILNKIRSAVVLVHKINGGTIAQKDTEVNKTKSTKHGNSNTQKMPRAGTQYRIDADSDIDFKNPNLGSGDAEKDYRMLTLAVAAAHTLPEFIVSGDASNNNLASIETTLTPLVRSIEEDQTIIEEIYKQIYIKVIESAVKNGRLNKNISLECDFKFPTFDIRDLETQVKADVLLQTAGVLSKTTMATKHGLDFEKEKELMDNELESTNPFIDRFNNPPENNIEADEPDD